MPCIRTIILLILIVSMVNSSYNPIPIGSVIISTIRTISILQPKEYGGSDKPIIIFTATKYMTIVNTIFDPTFRELYIIFSNTTTNILYISRLKSVEKLHPIIHRLPILFNTSLINKLTSFSSDIINKRAFLTDQTGTVTMFSMSGSMKAILPIRSTTTNPVRSVGFNENLNRLFIITDSTVNSCVKLDEENLQCCQALSKTDRLRSIAFDSYRSHSMVYVIDERTGIYQVILDSLGCPTVLRPINAFDNYQNIHLVVYENLAFCSASSDHSNHNSILIITNHTQTSRTIPFDASIVTLHISYPNSQSSIERDEICFHGITYHDYRVAVILAAIFGTIMGVFMCFNALFCIDFFMTKRIIRDLKKQIPHNLLEDRWNRLVQEKYARLALEIQRKKDDPQSKHPLSNGDGRPVNNPIPKISAYLRRKSEGYLSRRRSDEARFTGKSTAIDFASSQPGGIKEEDPNKLRENMSHEDLAKPKGELL